MQKPLLLLLSLSILLAISSFHAHAELRTRQLFRPLLALVKWTRKNPPKTPQTDGGDAVQIEKGFLVETIVGGNIIGVLPHSIRIGPDGELFVVDEANSNIMRITPPLSQYSKARLVAGSFQGHAGHVDGKPSDARFGHPKGLAVDGRGNVYVADTANMAIRKIGESGVTTIAGGKSNSIGYADGPSEDAKFSSDFDLMFDGSSCSLIVVDRGNAALRQISLHGEECSNHHSSVLSSDILMIAGAILVGYVTCFLQDGFVPTHLFKMVILKMNPEGALWSTVKRKKPAILEQVSKDEPKELWASFNGIFNKFKSISLTLSNIFFRSVSWLRTSKPKGEGLHPVKNCLVMPEDDRSSILVQKQRRSWTVPGTQQVNAATVNATQHKIPKTKPSGLKDYSASVRLRSSLRQDFPDLCRSMEASERSLPPSKSLKGQTRHRHHGKTTEVVSEVLGNSSKPAEVKAISYKNQEFGHYSSRRKFRTGGNCI